MDGYKQLREAKKVLITALDNRQRVFQNSYRGERKLGDLSNMVKQLNKVVSMVGDESVRMMLLEEGLSNIQQDSSYYGVSYFINKPTQRIFMFVDGKVYKK